MREFTPLPLRARNVLELLDTALKVYKQYFWVLLGWSAIVNLVAPLTGCGGILPLILTPLELGVAACCISAAVRGQPVRFGQCWQFSQSRFGGMLGWFLIAGLIATVIFSVVMIVLFGAGAFIAPLFQGNNLTLQAVVTAFGFLTAALILGVVATALLAWTHFPPLIVCMEENNRDKNIMRRSWDLLNGHWGRAISLMTILSLAMLALFAIMGVVAALIIGIDNVQKAFTGSNSAFFESGGFFAALIGLSFGSGMVMTLFAPAMTLAVTLFYLDLRVRKDALDLEWTAHVTAPPVAPSPPAPYGAPGGAPYAGPYGTPPAGPYAAHPAPPGTPYGTTYGAPPPAPGAPYGVPPYTNPQYPNAPYPPPSTVAPAPAAAPAPQNAVPTTVAHPAPVTPAPTPVAPLLPPIGIPTEAPPIAPPMASPGVAPLEAAPVESSPTTSTTSPPAAVPWQTLLNETSEATPNAVITPASAEAPAAPTATGEITCPNCGTRSPAGYLFCMSCGAQLPTTSQNSTPPNLS